MAALLLVSTTVKASTVLPMSEDEPFLQDLSELPAEQDKEFKRGGLCGMTRFGCPKGRVSDTFFLPLQCLFFFKSSNGS